MEYSDYIRDFQKSVEDKNPEKEKKSLNSV